MRLPLILSLVLLSPVGAAAAPNWVFDVAHLTPRERMGQMLVIQVVNPDIRPDTRRVLASVRPGGVILLGKVFRSAEAVRRAAVTLQRLARRWPRPVPLFISVNQEGGNVNLIHRGFVRFPSALATAAAGSPRYAYRRAYLNGLMLLSVGVNLNYAPVADIYTHHRDVTLSSRTYGDTPSRVRRYVRAALRGYERAGIIACVKHFPGHGRTLSDTHFDRPVLRLPFSVLDSFELVPFRQSGSRMPMVMMNHVIYRSIDSRPASMSRFFISRLLREKWGYDGVIMSDDIYMNALKVHYRIRDIVDRMLETDIDIIHTSFKHSRTYFIRDRIERAYKKGDVSASRLRLSCRRILTLKKRYGLGGPVLPGRERYLRQARRLRRRIAGRSVVVYRNRRSHLPVRERVHLTVISSEYRFSRAYRRVAAMLPPSRRPLSFRFVKFQFNPVPGDLKKVRRAVRRRGLIIVVVHNQKQRDIIREVMPHRKRTVFVSAFSPTVLGDLDGIDTFICSFSYIPPAYEELWQVIFGRRRPRGENPLPRLLPLP